MPDHTGESSCSDAGRLNRTCFCITLDRSALCAALERESGDPAFCAGVVGARPHLFSNAPVFLPAQALADMHAVVQAIQAAALLPGYREAVLSWAPAVARADHGPIGAFMGYDFHLDEDGPKLIEVNTNAGGAFLNALLARAQRACCAEVERGPAAPAPVGFEDAVRHMFEDEWLRQRGAGTARRIAIVDDRPEEQYLYPEFVLARQMLRKFGLDAVIVDAADLRRERDRLLAGGEPVDLVYNRLVDFALALPEHRALRSAYEDGAVVVTPNPHNHALLADKRNLTLLSDPAALAALGLPPEVLRALATVPRTVPVTPDAAEALWQARRHLFFKPTRGYGSKAVYRGDKLTRGVWAEILRGGYVAQDYAAPGERIVELDGTRVARKMDVRLYAHGSRILLAAARLYQGQATNFRTPGGGFAPVFAV